MVTPQNSQFRKQGSVWRAPALANQLLELGSQFGPEKICLVFFLLAFFVDVWCMALALLFIFQLSNKHGHVNTQELLKHLEI
jgi:hypothetical protein